MRIALVTVELPGRRGGAEVLYAGVEEALARPGHEVERVVLACDESTYEGILDGYRAVRALDLSRFDAVVSTKAPSFNVRHPNHVVYLLHTVRVFYDMFDAWSDGSAESRSRRDRIRKIDFEALSSVPDERRFAIGEEVAARLLSTLGLPSRVLHPPLADADRFREGPFEHFLHAGRLHPWKRADLVLRAYLSLSTEVPLLVTGSGEAEADLRRLAGGDERVRFLGEVERPVLYDLFSRALAVPFVPVREDYGYVAIEAMLSGKPVITASDSGEPARLVENDVNGLVVAPQPDAIAAAFRRFLESPEEARRMGADARARTAAFRGDEVADALLAPVAKRGHQVATVSRSSSRMRVLILDNQPIEPPIGGGRIRLFGLYSNLPPDLDPVYVGTYDWPGPAYRSVLHEGRLREITVPQSEVHFRAHEALRAADPTLGMDVTFPALSFLSAAFAQRVAYEARDAEVIVFSHPWVLPIVRRIPGLEGKPLVYDAHNVEGPLRRALLSKTGLGAGIAEMVENLERELCRSSAAIFACSEGDADELVSAYGADPERVHVLPNGTDVRRVHPATPEERHRARKELGLSGEVPVALFLGSDYPPNLEAARTLCRRLGPEMPALRFLLVGGCSNGLSPEEVPENVTALGVVDGPTRDRALAAADFAVNPMSRGSGTNIKMLDYFCAGLPAVTTPVGARGIDTGAGTAYLVTALKGFPAVIQGLLDSPERRSRMSRAARLLAESRFDWRQIGMAAGRVLRGVARRESVSRDVRSVPASPRRSVAVMSTWRTRCGIADYTASLTRGFPSDGDWRIYAEAGSCGAPEGSGVRRNWEIGLEDLSRLEADLETDAVDVLLVQHNPAFFREEALRRVLELAREKNVAIALALHAVQSLRMDAALASEMNRAGRIYVHRPSDAEWLAGFSVKKPVRVVPHGIARLPERSVSWVKDRIGQSGRFLIGHFGYLRPHKGVLELIEAFERLAPVLPSASLMLLCSEYPSADSRDYRRHCESRIASSPFSERIDASFEHMPLEAAGFLLQACDVLVFPYYPSAESASGAVRLGIASARPIIVSDSGIFEELRGIAQVAASIEPEPLGETILSFVSAEAREAAAARVRRFARECEWPRIASFVWGDLRSLAAPGAAKGEAGSRRVPPPPRAPVAEGGLA